MVCLNNAITMIRDINLAMESCVEIVEKEEKNSYKYANNSIY